MSHGLAMWLGGMTFGFTIGGLFWLGAAALLDRIRTSPPNAPAPPLPEVVTRAEAILRAATGKGRPDQ